MKVCFGILAWNEADGIARTIESVCRQSLLQNPPKEIEQLSLFVVVNGSTDGTATVAREALKLFFPEMHGKRLSSAVFELPEANRTAAWNETVHKFSDPDCDYIAFMDADIQIDERDSLENLLRCIHENPHAFAVSGNAIKEISLKKRKSIREQISLIGTNMQKKARLPFLTGPLYIGRATFWRRMYVPYGMCADDSLFTVLAWTNYDRQEIDANRVIECENAKYTFEAYVKLKDVFRQHRRRTIGGMMRLTIFQGRTERETDNEDIGDVMIREFSKDPYWMVKALENRVAKLGLRAMPWEAVCVPFTQLRVQPWYKKIALFPLSIAFALWKICVILGAYRTLKSGSLRSLWVKAGHSKPKDLRHC